MKQWKQILCAAALIAGTGLFAESYTSDGFSAEISKNGMLMNLKYKGQLLCNQIQINGGYHLPKDAKKYDARFFQGWDYTGQAVCKREGTTMTATTESKLGNTVLKDAADYKVEMTLTPKKITVKSSVKLNVPLLTNYTLFQSILSMPPALFGRGVKCVTDKGQERFEVLADPLLSPLEQEHSFLARQQRNALSSWIPACGAERISPSISLHPRNGPRRMWNIRPAPHTSGSSRSLLNRKRKKLSEGRPAFQMRSLPPAGSSSRFC